MDLDSAAVRQLEHRRSRFELAAPRRFLLPAVLLVLAEAPRHGYSLAKELTELRFGHIDRPSVYRALAQLERDEFVKSDADVRGAGQARRSYRITETGERVLRQWMGVIKEERDGLDRVLRRYVASPSLEARLAEVAGGWQSVTAPVFSPVLPSSWSDGVRRLAPQSSETLVGAMVDETEPTALHYDVDPERSVVLINARSSVGPIVFGAAGITGEIEVALTGGMVAPGTSPVAHLELAVDQLRSGNSVYDAELMRRIDVRRFPVLKLDLSGCTQSASTDRYRLRGEVDFHGSTQTLEGTIELAQPSSGTLIVRGEHTIDIRDFGVASPKVLMLRIYPDVAVSIQVEANAREEESLSC